MRIAGVLLAGLAVASGILAFNGDGFAEKFAALPQAVRDTAEAHMDNAFPLSITSAKGEHGWDYQINTRLNGMYHDLIINNQGGLVAVRDQVELSTLPEAARAAIERAAPASNILSVEKVTEGQNVSYGALTRDADGKPVQVRVAADGTVKPAAGK